ncbi:MAG: hypothetical protein BWY52_01450 [Chloroflexi bacterium ADurb.Bin325]|nr:MAG: hypothetical protein BWY52_01450 [Chloroflexi bacterium ADurb.Bin325]
MAKLLAQIIHGVGVLREDQHRLALLEDLVQLGLEDLQLGIGYAELFELLDEVPHITQLGGEAFDPGRRCPVGPVILLLKDVQFQFILLGVFVGEQRFDPSGAFQELQAALQAASDRPETAGEAAPVDGHDEAQPAALAFVLLVELGDVFLDAIVEGLFVRSHGHPHDLWFAGRHGFLQDALLVVLAQQGAGVTMHRPAERRMSPRHLGHVLPGFGPKLLQARRAFAVPPRQLLQDRPFHRPDVGCCLFSERGVQFTAGLQVVAHHVEDEVPIGLAERLAHLAEETQERGLVSAPATADAQHGQQIPHFQRVDLHRRGGQQQQSGVFVARLQVVEQAQQPVGAIDRLQEVLAAGMMRLVHHEQVPRPGRQDLFAPVAALGKLAAGQQYVAGIPEVGAAGHRQRPIVDIEQLAVFVARDFQGELLVELLLPLVEDRFGRQDQATFDPAGDEQLADHQAGLDGLAQADLVAQQRPARKFGQELMRDARLMRPGRDRCGCGAQAGRARQVGRIAHELEKGTLCLGAAAEIP